MAEKEKILEIKNLNMEFRTGKHQTLKALNNVSFDIYKGENFGLVGESGCGKTTLGRTLIRLYDPTSGELIFNGKKISGKLDKETRNYIVNNLAMIFQDPISSLNPRMTVQEIIAEGLKTKGIKDKAEQHRQVAEILDKVGLLPEHATRYPHEFSGGQRQRIGIARALVLKPSFIIADEPVSALDVSIQAQVINLLMDIKKEMNLTILFIAHDLAVVKYFSDRIGVMCFGNLVELADADELYAHPIHPYTKALLSAIPQPDPLVEKKKKRIYYDPSMNDYSREKPSFQEIRPGHFVYASDSEMEKYRRELNEQ
ncbi:MAG TPA: ATP-binding cassette domain-containing protein [Candidatus Hungatella pullicola]|nr:ATP-binding cassette domain-containing protein [Candidatus Hungatella pullicola]